MYTCNVHSESEDYGQAAPKSIRDCLSECQQALKIGEELAIYSRDWVSNTHTCRWSSNDDLLKSFKQIPQNPVTTIGNQKSFDLVWNKSKAHLDLFVSQRNPGISFQDHFNLVQQVRQNSINILIFTSLFFSPHQLTSMLSYTLSFAL